MAEEEAVPEVVQPHKIKNGEATQHHQTDQECSRPKGNQQELRSLRPASAVAQALREEPDRPRRYFRLRFWIRR